MKKTILIIMCLCLLLLCGCVDFFTYDDDGIWESDDPQMRIVDDNDPSIWGDDGILTLEDGSIIPIVYHDLQGKFSVYENKGDDTRGHASNLLFKGTYRYNKRKDALILKTTDDKEIILKRVSYEIPETESSVET